MAYWRLGWLLGGVVLAAGCSDPRVASGGEGSSGPLPDGDETHGGSQDEGSEESGEEAPPAAPFEGARLISVDLPSSNTVFGDFDGDGDDDIAVEHSHASLGNRTLAFYALTEDDRFDLIQESPLALWPARMVAGYINADAQLDVIGWGPDESFQVVVREDGLEVAPPVAHDGTPLGRALDIDGDLRSEWVQRVGDDLFAYEVDLEGGWTRTSTVALDLECDPVAARWADVDHDGALDLVAVAPCHDGSARLQVYAQESDGLVLRSTTDLDFSAEELSVADFDDDGLLDVLATERKVIPSEPSPVGRILRGSGDGAFEHPLVDLETTDPSTFSFETLVADLDGDGVAEALPAWDLSDEVQRRTRLLVVGADGTPHFTPVEHDIVFSAAADFDGDGCDDLIHSSGVGVLLLACDG